MEMNATFGRLAAFLLFCCAAAACHPQPRHVLGTLEPDADAGQAPAPVREVVETAPLTSGLFEYLLSDEEDGVAVLSLLRCSEEQSSEGYGVVTVCGTTRTGFPDIRHGNMPQASFNPDKGELWLVGADAEGTGLRVERPYLLRFDGSGHASIAATIAPYDMQEELCKHLTFSVRNKNISFFADGAPLGTASIQETEMGDLYDDPVWIGEQLCYVLADDGLTVHVTPGLIFNTGKVLLYDDMPTVVATVTPLEGGFSLSDFRIEP